MNLVKQVIEFHIISDEPCKDGPKILSSREWVKHQSILQKSLDHISDACWSKKGVEDATLAIANTMYILATVACEMGVHTYLQDCIDEVHRVKLSGAEDGASEQSLEAVRQILQQQK